MCSISVFSFQPTVTVTKGNDAILEWDVSGHLTNLEYQIYSNDTKIISGNSKNVIHFKSANEKYGLRINVKRIGIIIRLTLKEAIHSDEAIFTLKVELGSKGTKTVDEITLDVTGFFFFFTIFHTYSKVNNQLKLIC